MLIDGHYEFLPNSNQPKVKPVTVAKNREMISKTGGSTNKCLPEHLNTTIRGQETFASVRFQH